MFGLVTFISVVTVVVEMIAVGIGRWSIALLGRRSIVLSCVDGLLHAGIVHSFLVWALMPDVPWFTTADAKLVFKLPSLLRS
jgi:hypothetical protein